MTTGPVDLLSWAGVLAAELDVDAHEVDLVAILELARRAAHEVMRPAAPVTTFLAGYAAGLRGGGAAHAASAMADAAEAITRHAPEQVA